MNKLRLLFCCLSMTTSLTMLGQGAKNIVISEVMTNNTASIQDEYGKKEAWLELSNTSFSTYNVRGMYLTTDRSVLDKEMNVPERVKRMYPIPNGDERTNIGARHFIVLFANSNPAKGKLHLSLPVNPSEPVWVALYNANGVELIDSVTIPVLEENQSYARVNGSWAVKAPENVTPGIENFIKADESKVAKFKREDPHGFAMAIMAMGIVFFCLALLWIFFTLFGLAMRHIETAKKVAHQQPIKPITVTVEKTLAIGHKTSNVLQEGFEKRGIDMEVYMAVIGMALKQYEDDVHDVESGIITIKSKDTEWGDEYTQMTQWHDPFIPTESRTPRIPTTPELR